MTTIEDFGRRLGDILKEQGYTQKALAEKIGLSPNALCTLLKGRSFPPRKTLNAICEALDIDILLRPRRLRNMIHTNINMTLDTKVGDKRLRDMTVEETMNMLKACGNEQTDIVITDDGKEVAGYDSESGQAYYIMKVKEAFLQALGL